jgi:hypothetical protein
MSVLVLQIIIKQWDKSQRTVEHQKLRASIPDKYSLVSPPAIYVFDQHCIIDQHGDDIQGERIKYFKDAEGKIKIDRFQIDGDSIIQYDGSKSQQIPVCIGSLNKQWIQCKYNCRYSIFESELFYWLYEEVTLNAICVNKLNKNVFLNAEPAIIYEDFIELDSRKKA